MRRNLAYAIMTILLLAPGCSGFPSAAVDTALLPGLVAMTPQVEWEPDHRLTFDPGASQLSINFARSIAADDSGGVHVVWQDERDGNAEIYYKRSTDHGRTWGPDRRLTTDPAPSAQPSPAASGSDVHVVWWDVRAGRPQIYYKRSTDGGTTWGADRRLTENPAPSQFPSVAATGSDVHVVWVEGRDGNSEVYYQRSSDGGFTWDPDMRLSDLPFSSWTPTIAVSGSNVYVAWTDRRHGDAEEEYFKRSTDGGINWGPDTRLTYDPANSWAPSLAAADSNVWLFWFDERDSNWEIYSKRSTDGGSTWSADTRLTNDPAISVRPSAAVLGSTVDIVWWDRRDGNEEIYTKRSTDSGRAWGPDTRLTKNPARSRFPSVARTATFVHVIWQDERDGNTEIYYKRRNSSPRSTVGNGLIVYVGRDTHGQEQIFTIMPDGSNKRQLTHTTGGNFFPAWSHDGKKIAFTSVRTGAPELWVMDADGGNQTQLTAPPESGNFVPAWSFDGTRIVFASTRTGHPEVWIMDADGSDERRLTTTPVRPGEEQLTWSLHANFSPDGKIVYASTRNVSSQVWIMEADGSSQTQLTMPVLPNFPDANAPSWSPDGARIAFWSGFETQYGQVWVMEADGSNRSQLTNCPPPFNCDNPAWSPDGSQILFETNRGGPVETWIMEADGSNQRRLFPFPYGAGRLPWQP